MPEYTMQQFKDKCRELGFTGDADQFYTQWASAMNHVPPAPVSGFATHDDLYLWLTTNYSGTL